MLRRDLPLVLLGVLTLGACDAGNGDGTSGPPPIGAVTAGAEPVFASASTPSLAVDASGAVHLSATVKLDSTAHALRFATMRNGAWSEPRDIARDRAFFVNWADFPSIIALDNGDLAAHWLEREGEGTYSYGVRIARSRDGGAV
jgi:hypothetical protein